MIINNFKKILDKYNQNHKKPLSLRKVARMTGATTYSITALYNGQAKGLKFDVLNKLIGFFNVPLSDIISYTHGSINLSLYDSKIKAKKKSIILSDNGMNISFTTDLVTPVMDLDPIVLDNSFNDSNMKPLTSNCPHFSSLVIGIQDKYSGSPNKYNFAKNLLNTMPEYFRDYIYTRALLHSGKLNIKNHNRYHYQFSDNGVTSFKHRLKPVTISELIKWQSSQTKKSNSYYMSTKSEGKDQFKINLYDYTTNNFKS